MPTGTIAGMCFSPGMILFQTRTQLKTKTCQSQHQQCVAAVAVAV